MKRLRTKLQSRGGASIVIALVFFLLCVTVGTIIYTAASANAGRLISLRQAKQDYLTVASAARLLRDELDGIVFAGTKTTTTTVVSNEAPEVTDPVKACETNGSTWLRGLLQDDAAYYYGASNTSADTHSIQIADSSEPKKFDAVDVTMVMGSNYGLTIELYIAGDNGEKRSPLHMEARAEVTLNNSTSTEYSPPVLAEDGTVTQESRTVTTDVETTTVTWGSATITKGETGDAQ